VWKLWARTLYRPEEECYQIMGTDKQRIMHKKEKKLGQFPSFLATFENSNVSIPPIISYPCLNFPAVSKTLRLR
jgi:hypothetical protein